jgi:hypothetical protein
MGPLEFAAGSHRFQYGRDLPIGDESEAKLQEALGEAGFEKDVEPFDLGDVSFHLGWTYNRAGANRTERPRRVMTIIYMDETARLAEPSNPIQEEEARTWCPGVKVGELCASPLNPVLYPA